MLRGGRC